jgi:hypothetical protein
VSFDAQAARLAQAALDELDAEEPNPSPATLMGGEASWGHWLTRVEADRDPANAPAMRPHVVAVCQQLSRYPAIRLHCTCGRGLDFLALAPFATGVLVVSSPSRLPKKLRSGGGVDALAPIDPSEDSWSLTFWEQHMQQRAADAKHATSWDNPPAHAVLGPEASLVGDSAKRQTFTCTGCGATRTFKNVTLLRLVLQAIAAGERHVRFDGRAGPPPTPRA